MLVFIINLTESRITRETGLWMCPWRIIWIVSVKVGFLYPVGGTV